MSTVEETIQSTLATAGIPVFFASCRETTRPAQYIVWTMALVTVELYGDDVPLELGFYVQVSIWSRTEYFALAETVREAMLSAGFRIRDERDAEYDPETQYYGRIQRYFFLDGV